MRLLLVSFGVLALVVPAAGMSARHDPNQGTLSVHNGRGTFIVNGRGGVIGSFVKGRVTITDPIPSDGTGPIVSGDDWHKLRNGFTTVYGGSRVRFRLIGGTFRIRIAGSGVNLSVVGRGNITLEGQGTLDDGTYSVNGEAYAPVPDFVQFRLSATTP